MGRRGRGWKWVLGPRTQAIQGHGLSLRSPPGGETRCGTSAAGGGAGGGLRPWAGPTGRGRDQSRRKTPTAARWAWLTGGGGARPALTPLSMVCVWHSVPSAAGMLLVMHRLLLLRHHSSLQTSCGPRHPLRLAPRPPPSGCPPAGRRPAHCRLAVGPRRSSAGSQGAFLNPPAGHGLRPPPLPYGLH